MNLRNSKKKRQNEDKNPKKNVKQESVNKLNYKNKWRIWTNKKAQHKNCHHTRLGKVEHQVEQTNQEPGRQLEQTNQWLWIIEILLVQMEMYLLQDKGRLGWDKDQLELDKDQLEEQIET